MFNTANERRRSKDDGNKTAGGSREECIDGVEDKFRLTDRNNRLSNHSYSIELKQKIERMQLARLRIQKMRRTDKAGFMIIKSHSP